jgi:kinesin family protein C1
LADLLCCDESKSVKISHRADGSTELENSTSISVSHKEDIFSSLSLASLVRATAATSCNERSSRSHAVFSLSVKGKKKTRVGF